jgi:hypothetical protein
MDVEVGDYVFATKYSDGDPRDHFVVGFIVADVGMWRPGNERWTVVDDDGHPFRGNGFRRVRPINRRVGSAMCGLMREGDPERNLHGPGHSMWDVLNDLEAAIQSTPGPVAPQQP